tara:strand:+ start:108 stop:485 length:378 start_codon:yes stop_codon:yes gene_type:complete
MNEYITVANSDLKFVKPNFRCELVKVLDKKILAITDDICGNYGSSRWYDFNGTTQVVQFRLTPYIEHKIWYDDKDNFPKILSVRLENKNMYKICNSRDSFLYLSGFGYKLATNEEIDSLKLKDRY